MTKAELPKKDTIAKISLGSRAEVTPCFNDILPKYLTFLDTIALKSQNATFSFKRTERVDEKKKKEVEIIEEWTEDNSRYVDLSGLTTCEQIIEFIRFS